jgi:hypothetical protein
MEGFDPRCHVTRRSVGSANDVVKFMPDVVPALVQRWRELVNSIESLADNPTTTLQDMAAARDNLRALLGTVTLKPRDGILWAHPAPNARGLTEVRPLDGLSIPSASVDRRCRSRSGSP